MKTKEPLNMLGVITKIQEVYFDLCDARNDQFLSFKRGSDTPQGYENAGEWIQEQIERLEYIEDMVKLLMEEITEPEESEK